MEKLLPTYPRCANVRKDGTPCAGSALFGPDGEPTGLCFGCTRKQRRQAVTAELMARADSLDVAALLERLDADVTELSTEQLAYSLAALQKT